MELFDLKYFVEVARFENLHQAAKELRVAPATLSKSVARLESELNIELFVRSGRTIELTEHGSALQPKALDIIRYEQEVRASISGGKSVINVGIAGREFLLLEIAPILIREIARKYPKLNVNMFADNDEEAISSLNSGKAQVALITGTSPSAAKSKVLKKIEFKTFVGKKHPLYKQAAKNEVIPIEEVLKFSFVSLSTPVFGKMLQKQSYDGWRDDQFKRIISYTVPTAQLMGEIAQGGLALAYLPEDFAKKLDGAILKISGCPFSCTQEIKMIARQTLKAEWLKFLWDEIRFE